MREFLLSASGSDGVVMTSPEVEQEILERSLTEHVPRYAVILLSEQDAIKAMMDAHTDGTAVVTVCPLETAEFYRDRLQSFSIGASIEAA